MQEKFAQFFNDDSTTVLLVGFSSFFLILRKVKKYSQLAEKVWKFFTSTKNCAFVDWKMITDLMIYALSCFCCVGREYVCPFIWFWRPLFPLKS